MNWLWRFRQTKRDLLGVKNFYFCYNFWMQPAGKSLLNIILNVHLSLAFWLFNFSLIMRWKIIKFETCGTWLEASVWEKKSLRFSKVGQLFKIFVWFANFLLNLNRIWLAPLNFIGIYSKMLFNCYKALMCCSRFLYNLELPLPVYFVAKF